MCTVEVILQKFTPAVPAMLSLLLPASKKFNKIIAEMYILTKREA